MSGPHTPALELAILTDIARVQPFRAAYKAAVEAPGAYSARVRERRRLADALVAESLTLLALPGDADELSWTPLRSLFVIELQVGAETVPFALV